METPLIFVAAQFRNFLIIFKHIFHNMTPPTQLSQRTNKLLILLGKMREKK